MPKLVQAKKNKEHKDFKGYIAGGITAIVLALAFWGLLLMAEEKSLSEYDTEEYLVFSQSLPKGTQITEEMVTALTRKTEYLPENVPSDVITDVNEMTGTYLSCDVSENMICSQALLQTIPFDEEDSFTLSFKVKETDRCVNGTLRASDTVSIYFTSPNYSSITETTEHNLDGKVWTEQETVYKPLEKTYTEVFLKRVFDADGTQISNSDTTSKATAFEIVVSNEASDDIISMLALGYNIYVIKEN